MKKLFLALAFTGILGAASANTIASFTHVSVITVSGDEKKKKGDKKDAKTCTADAKATEKGGAKACCKEGAGHSCCHGAAPAKPAAPAEAPKK
jgi:hypothetical protein